MYTISYVDRTNISLALDPSISTLAIDLGLDDRAIGFVAGIFFWGYPWLQIPGNYWASRWSARKIVSIFLIAWGVCAVGCGLAHTLTQMLCMRFLLGLAESGVYPATLVLLAHWFPRAERARANAYWILCQPLAVALSAPINGRLLKTYGWEKMIIVEGILPFLWLPIWWFFIRDHPREAKWISAEERTYLETTLQREAQELEIESGRRSDARQPGMRSYVPAILVMLVMYFFQNFQAYGCMTFFSTTLKGKGFDATQYGVLFGIPYALAAVLMILNSWHSDKTGERRGHVALAYGLSGVCLIASVALKEHFWISYLFLCLSVQGPFAGQAPFWAIPTETMPRSVTRISLGLVNAIGNLGGFAGPFIVGWLKRESHGSVTIGFGALGLGMVIAAALAFLLPKSARQVRPPPTLATA